MPSQVLVAAGMALVMAGGALGAWIATPTTRVADTRPAIDIGRLVPVRFGGWQLDPSVVPVHADPGVQAELRRIYAQTLSRTYIDARGRRVMLVIAYGGEQDDSLGVHTPDVCYPAQGFEILSSRPAMLDTGFGIVPVSRLVARRPRRYEPVTYWIRVGDTVDAGGLGRKLTQLRYGMAGLIPDGVLFRVSSLGDDADAFALQRSFTSALLAAMDPQGRAFLLGRNAHAPAPAAAARQGN
jgi:EpsI family protein